MNISIDAILENLWSHEQRFHEIIDYLFQLLERRSLFTSAEHLALRVLEDSPFALETKLARQLETYRAMKIGSTATDILFDGDLFAPGYNPDHLPEKLSGLSSNYTVVVFTESECPECAVDLTEMANHYPAWKEHGVEVVLVILDEDQESCRQFVGDVPFISICDDRSWDSPIVSDYHVFATPTMYLLDSNREILLHPNSANHINAWVEWYLGGGN